MPNPMNPALTAALLLGCLAAVVALGRVIGRRLPDHHLTGDSKDAIKLAMGLVATMTALLLGLLVSSAKGSYDTDRSEVLQMAAKVTFLDRILSIYGPDAADVRAKFRHAVADGVEQMWPREAGLTAPPQPNLRAAAGLYIAIQQLSPRDDTQRSLKAQATSLALELGQLRTLLLVQSVPSISKPLLIMVVCWLMVLFLSFSLIAPHNATTTLALMASAFSVAGAVFLILELDHPLDGLIQIPSAPMLNALHQLAK